MPLCRIVNVVAKRAYGVDNYYTARTQDAIDNAIISEILKEFVARIKSMVGIPSL